MAVNQRSHAPSSDEISKAVGHLLRESKTYVTPKEVRETLLRDHQTWNIPERRVAKFLKKEKRAMKYKGESSGVSGFFGKMFGSNKQKSAKDDSTAPLPEMHPAAKSTGKLGNLTKAFSKKEKTNEFVAPTENVFRESKLDTGTEKTTLPYEKAELERQEITEKEVAPAEDKPSEEIQVDAIQAEEKLPEDPEKHDKEIHFYVDDKEDDQNNLCHCDVCVIL